MAVTQQLTRDVPGTLAVFKGGCAIDNDCPVALARWTRRHSPPGSHG